MGFEVLGVLPRDAGIEIPSRHLGLVPAAEREEAAETVAELAQADQRSCLTELDLSVARSAPPLEASRGLPPTTCDRRQSASGGRRSRPAGPLPFAMPRPTSCYELPDANQWSSTRPQTTSASGGNSRALPGRRISRGALQLSWRPTSRCDPRFDPRSRPVCRRSPSAPGLLYLCRRVDWTVHGRGDRG